MTVGRLRNEDLSMFFFIKELLSGKVTTIVDGFPYTEIDNQVLVVPSVSVEHMMSSETRGELGSPWVKRSWELNVFAQNDTQRDEIAETLFKGLNLSVPIRDYSGGFRKETGKALAGTDLPILEWVQPEERSLRPAPQFMTKQQAKYWRLTISFSTVSTDAG
jgi:hypothetical protein